MLLKDYIKELQSLVEFMPEAAEFIVVTAKDAEGNGYDEVYYGPSIGHLDTDGDFRHPDEDDDEEDDYPHNAVCVN